MLDRLANTSLSEPERRAVAAVVAALEAELGERLKAAWLYGSRARGEEPGEDSDIDLMIVAEGGRPANLGTVWEVIERVAPEHGGDPIRFSPRVVDPEWVEGRRRIRSFFIEEVDRDKLVLSGSG